MQDTAQTLSRPADLLVKALEVQGVDTVFGVPGESYLAVLDALHDSAIRFVPNRHEGGAAFMAEALAKLTGRVGICFVTRGPGATNAAIGVHTAMQNATPMVLFVGQVARSMRGREAFQEIDYRAMFGSVAKWAVEIEEASRVTEIVARAFTVALSGRPGPVVVALPEDMLVEQVAAQSLSAPVVPAMPAAEPAVVAAAARALIAAERPLIMLGGGGWDGDPSGRAALAALTTAAEAAALPIVVTFRCQDLINNNSPAYVGDASVGMTPTVKRLIREADTLLAINLRFGENTTDGYTLLEVPEPRQRLIHVHPDAGEIGKIYRPAMAVQAGPVVFAAAMADLLPELLAEEVETAQRDARLAWQADGRAAYEAGFDLPPQPEGLDMGAVMATLRARLPSDAILTNGAGNFAIWPSRLFRYGPAHRLLAPQSGAMGYGLPAAIAAKAMFRDRVVVCFAGDGDVQMTMAELGTAMQIDARPILLVVNNASYGTIRMHQERHYPARISATRIENPDYLAIAAAYGMPGERVETTEAFAPALERALASPTGALIELIQPTEALTPRESLSAMRATALARDRAARQRSVDDTPEGA
ncbi:MAG: thiamine pyrophosphate-binding protein [Pseudomonadota bacterium]